MQSTITVAKNTGHMGNHYRQGHTVVERIDNSGGGNQATSEDLTGNIPPDLPRSSVLCRLCYL